MSERLAGGVLIVLAGGVLIVLTGAACAGTYEPPLPLRPDPIPYADTLPIPEPEAKDMNERLELFQDAVVGPVRRPIRADKHEALDVTRFDDVVSSAWFEHRNGREPMSPEAVARGPTTGSGPDTSGALAVIAAKTEGVTPGFTVRDARGDRYIVKLDSEGHLGLSSATGVIVNRLFHAAGYHVPEDYILVFDGDRLEVDPEAEGDAGEPLSEEDLREILERGARLPDGRYRGLASKFVPGVPKGPFLFEGTWEEDPNDHYHHEYRRELRGLFVVAAWLNHVDMRFANSLDVYVEPGYIRHYVIDLASALGSSAGRRSHTPRHGREYQLDLWPVLLRYVTLGTYAAGWEFEDWDPIDPSVGWMPVETYDPGNWKPGWPAKAFLLMTDRDGYWGAKLVASFTDEQVRAAVAEGGLSEAVSDTLSEILRYRRDATVRYWFSEVTPIEDARVERTPRAGGERAEEEDAGGGPAEATVSFRDLGLERGLWTAAETRYRWELVHEARGIRWEGETAAGDGPRQVLRLAAGDAERKPAEPDYRTEHPALAVLRVTALRAETDEDPATVYLQWTGPAGRYRVLGLEH